MLEQKYSSINLENVISSLKISQLILQLIFFFNKIHPFKIFQQELIQSEAFNSIIGRLNGLVNSMSFLIIQQPFIFFRMAESLLIFSFARFYDNISIKFTKRLTQIQLQITRENSENITLKIQKKTFQFHLANQNQLNFGDQYIFRRINQIFFIF
ncbi:unnamed protein product [Paramecium sonneborni]|uniref:Uncharacterized protein n=1 Tax=Paramecium sonneborni TaxID=65129 RepID=A0A8S1PXP5_9CILI|nr:unnamed protein product [Paramecium sonneborni]